MKLIDVGYQSTHDSDFSIRRPHGYGAYLLLFMKTKSFHVLNNKKEYLSANSVILYDETTPQHYGAVSEQYIDDWVHFTMDKQDLILFEKFSIPLNTIFSTSDSLALSSVIRNITFEFYSAGSHRESSSILYLQILLNKLSELTQSENKSNRLPFYHQLVTLRTEIYNMPDLNWKIDTMSMRLNLSSSYFQHIYKNLFGISAINDVINSRIMHSKKLLTGTSFPIKKIAALSGYEYDVYFMRQFKQLTGLTPKEYRKQTCESDFSESCTAYLLSE